MKLLCVCVCARMSILWVLWKHAFGFVRLCGSAG